MMDQWLRTLTLAGEGHDPDTTMALIDAVSHPHTFTLRFTRPAPHGAEQAIQDVVRWYTEFGSRQLDAHFVVDSLLINMVAEATGGSWADVVQALAAGLTE